MPQRQPRNRLATITLALALPFLTTLASPGRSVAEDPGSIPWRPSFEHAVAEAQQRRQPLWIQFTGPWCRYCQQMEATTLRTQPVVAEAQSRFVPVQVRNDVREDLAYQYGVTALPTTLLLAPTGEILGRHTGYLDAGSMLGLLASAHASYIPPPPEPSLGGIDPVHLVKTGEVKAGRPEYLASYDERVYRFDTEEDRDAFLRDPERYVPSNRGLCIVEQVDEGESVQGNPKLGVYYKDRLYLCSTEAMRQRFASHPERYANSDLAFDGNCPHCQSLAGREIKGSARYATTFEGRRYLFPDAAHRAAFRADPSRYVR